MKAITLHQPWATLVAIGAKRFETRSWRTSYRGPLAIHAGKRWTWEQQERDEAVREFSDEVRSWLREQPRETQARIELRAKDRARELGGDDFEPASHPHLLTAYVEQIAAEEAGIEPPPELRGTGPQPT